MDCPTAKLKHQANCHMVQWKDSTENVGIVSIINICIAQEEQIGFISVLQRQIYVASVHVYTQSDGNRS